MALALLSEQRIVNKCLKHTVWTSVNKITMFAVEYGLQNLYGQFYFDV